MSKQKWNFRALDTLFFRDGTPYYAGEGGYARVQSSFPPYISTLQGAIRTNLALQRGWSPEAPDRWPVELGTPDDLGVIRLSGPYLFSGEEPYFPLPLMLVTGSAELGEAARFIRLIPGDVVACDLGEVCLPVPAQKCAGSKLPEDCWVSAAGLAKILAGKVPGPGETKNRIELWSNEARIGLQRDNATRTAVTGRLYSCVHVRPCRGTELVVLVSGVPDGWETNRRFVSNLGGEGRMVDVAVELVNEAVTLLPEMPDLQPGQGKLRFTVILVTPGWYEHADIARVIKEGPPGVPGCCLSACVGKTVQVGGWDLVNARPRPLHPLLPAGSAWFFEADPDQLGALKRLHGSCIGAKPEYGYGQILIGRWDAV